jgi:uncharacterized protein (DUF362 family)
MSTVCVRRADRANPLPTIRDMLNTLRWHELVSPGATVAIKPNLCTERPEQIHTANTSLSVLRGVCQLFLERTNRICIVESDGARYPAEAAFENNGVYRLGKELGISVINLSRQELVTVADPRLAGFGMARSWLEADVFVTLPVLKTHATTLFTGALKNQWGCIPRHDRILLHPHLHDLIAAINHLRPVNLALMDGLVGMQGRGPINGYPINMNVLLASRDPVALDATAMRLIGLTPARCRHVMAAQSLRLGTISEQAIEIDGPFHEMQTTVEPAIEDWAIKLLNSISHSRFLTRLLLMNNGMFYPARCAVTLIRRLLNATR